MGSSDHEKIPKLKGTSNYPVWSIRLTAYLTKQKLLDAISNPDTTAIKSSQALAEIQLLCEDGPLLQIQHQDTAFTAWEALKNLYNPSGFTTEYLLIKEFFDSNLSKFSSIEEYLNKIKGLVNELNVRDIKLPKQVIVAWVLYSLEDQYEHLVGSITQELRKDPESYTFESLSASLIDEAKRFEYKEDNDASVNLFKGKKPWKAKKTYTHYKYYKKTGYTVENYAHLHPEKAPHW
jgi:hypothetical protein